MHCWEACRECCNTAPEGGFGSTPGPICRALFIKPQGSLRRYSSSSRLNKRGAYFWKGAHLPGLRVRLGAHLDVTLLSDGRLDKWGTYTSVATGPCGSSNFIAMKTPLSHAVRPAPPESPPSASAGPCSTVGLGPATLRIERKPFNEVEGISWLHSKELMSSAPKRISCAFSTSASRSTLTGTSRRTHIVNRTGPTLMASSNPNWRCALY